MTERFSKKTFVERLLALGGDGDREIAVLDEIDSTSTELRRRLKSGRPAKTVVVAHRQTDGRGRLGRQWHSAAEGNLCLSVAVQVGGPTAETVPLLPLAAGSAACEAIREAGVQALLKWPNDVLFENRKLAGILCETNELTKESALVVVGLGINIADQPFPEDIARTAGNVNGVLQQEADMSLLAARFLFSLENWNRRILDGARVEVVEAWRSAAEPFGRRVKVGEVTGKTVDLTPDGRLIVREDAGREIHIVGGIVESLDLF